MLEPAKMPECPGTESNRPAQGADISAVRRGISQNQKLRTTLKTNGAQGQNRTADTGIFSPLLYRLSYLGIRYHTKPPIRHPDSLGVNTHLQKINCLNQGHQK